MAWELIRDERFEPEATEYRGFADKLIAELTGPPEQIMPVGIASSLIQWFSVSVKNEGGTPLTIKIWADIAPTWETKYKVEMVVHTSPFAWNLAIYAIAGLIVLVGLSFIMWQVQKTTHNLGIPEWAWIVGAVAVGYLLLKRTKITGE